MKNRIISCLLLIALIFSVSGCSKTPAATSTAASTYDKPEQVVESWRNDTSPVTLTLSSEVHALSGGLKWADDPVSRMVTDLTGVQLVLQHGSEEASQPVVRKDKLGNIIHEENVTFYSVLAASGEWTDLVYLSSEADVNRMAASGDAAALDELAAQYCPDFWYSIDELELLNNTESNGHVYTLRNGYRSEDFYADETIPADNFYVLNLRKDILDKMELSMPTSVEELEKLLYTVKDSGRKLLMTSPLEVETYQLSRSPIAMWMGAQPYDYLSADNAVQWDAEKKSVISPMSDKAWLPYLLKMNQWYRDGVLVIPDLADIGAMPSKYGTFADISSPLINGKGSLTGYHIRSNDKAGSDYPVSVITSPLTWEGELQSAAADHARYKYGGGDGLFISSTCHNKERAIYFYQFLRSEDGARLTHWGIEGEHYTLDEAGHMTMAEAFAVTPDMTDMSLDDQFASILRAENTFLGYWSMVDNPMVEGMYMASPKADYTNFDVLTARAMMIEAGLNHKKLAAQSRILPLSYAIPREGDPDYKQFRELETLWLDSFVPIVTAASTEQAQQLWDELQSQLNQKGLFELEKSMTYQFKEALKRYQAAGYYTDIRVE